MLEKERERERERERMLAIAEIFDLMRDPMIYSSDQTASIPKWQKTFRVPLKKLIQTIEEISPHPVAGERVFPCSESRQRAGK